MRDSDLPLARRESMLALNPWRILATTIVAAVVSGVADAKPPAQNPPAPAPAPISMAAPESARPSFLEVILQDEAALYRHHASFEPPLEVDLAGTPGTLKFTRYGNGLSVVVRPRDGLSSCEPLWSRVMEALDETYGPSSPRQIHVRPSGLRMAHWGPTDRSLMVRCYEPKSEWPIRFEVIRGYRQPPRSRIEPRWAPPTFQLPLGRSYVDVLFEDASAFLDWGENRLHGSRVELAGVTGRVVAEWFGDGDALEVSVEPERGTVTACEPHWDRLLNELTKHLGAPDEPERGSRLVGRPEARSPHTLLHEGERRARWHHRNGIAISAKCHEQQGRDGGPASVTLSVTRHHSL
jgi:hypothetical protein